MKLFLQIGVIAVTLGVLTMSAQVVVATGGIVHAADNSSSAPGSGLPQGGLFTIYGQRLGTTAQANALPLTTSLGGAQVNIRGANGTVYPAPLLFVSAGQINALLPSNVPTGTATLTVTVSGQTSAPQNFAVVPSRFGILTVSSSGVGPGIIQNFDAATQLPVLNRLSQPAASGQTLILWGIGLGAYTAGPDAQAPAAGNIGSGVEILVGGQTVRPAYAGRAPGFPGVDQINFVIPEEVEDGCFVPVRVRAGGVESNVVSVAKGAGPCYDPFGFTQSQKDTLERGGLLKMGLFDLRVESSSGELGLIATRKDIGSLGVATNSTSALAQMRGGPFVPPLPGAKTGCTVARRQDRGERLFVLQQTGQPLTISGNNDIRLALGAKTQNVNSYSDTLLGEAIEIRIPGAPPTVSGEPFFAAGQATMQFAGGSQTPAFIVTQILEEFLTLDLPDSAYTTNFGTAYTVRWKPGGVKPGDLVGVALQRSSNDGQTVVAIRCVADRAAGSFTIPGNITAQLPQGGSPATLVLYGTARSTLGNVTGSLDMVVGFQTFHAQTVVAIR